MPRAWSRGGKVPTYEFSPISLPQNGLAFHPSMALDSVDAAPNRGPVFLRKTLEDLGPTFVKAGQFLAMRPDLIDQRYADELLTLVDRASPFSWDVARRLIAEDLGSDPEEL